MVDGAALHIGRQAGDIAVVHRHREAGGKGLQLAADAAHAENAKMAADHSLAEQLGRRPTLPPAGAHHPVALPGPARSGEQQQQRAFGGGDG